MTAGRVLVVDDAVINRRLLERLVREQGHEVETAEDGLAALERLSRPEDGTFDVVLLDLLMPGLDGYGTLERMKADPALAHLPVIVISAVEELHSVVRCIELGALDYLPKPVDPSILRARSTPPSPPSGCATSSGSTSTRSVVSSRRQARSRQERSRPSRSTPSPRGRTRSASWRGPSSGWPARSRHARSA